MNGKLTNLQEQILEELKAEIRKKGDVSIQNFCSSHFVSPAFLVKLSQKLGYSGYKELLFSLKMGQVGHQVVHVNDGMVFPELFIGNYSEELMKRIADKFRKAKNNYIYANGRGYSSLVVEYVSMRSLKKGYRVIYMESFKEIPEHADNIAILVSESGETEDILETAIACKKIKTCTIGFTQNGNSRLAKMVDIPIIISKWKDAENYGINSFVSNAIMVFEFIIAKL